MTEKKSTFLEKWRASGGPVAPILTSSSAARILRTTAAIGVDFGRDVNAATEVVVRVDTAIKPQLAAAIQQKRSDIATAQRDADMKDANALLIQVMGNDIDDIELDPDPVPKLQAELADLERKERAAHKVSRHARKMLGDAIRSETTVAKLKEGYVKTIEPLATPVDIDPAANLTDRTKARVVAAVREEQAEIIAATLEDVLALYLEAIGGTQSIDKRQRDELEAAWAVLPEEMPTIESVHEALYGESAMAEREGQLLEEAEAKAKEQKLANQKYAAENSKSRQGGQDRPPEWAKDSKGVTVA